MTLLETITSIQTGDTLCGITITRHDKEALDRLAHVLLICETFDQVATMLTYNKRAKEWFARLRSTR